MQITHHFTQSVPDHDLERLKKDWVNTLTSPQDGMWEHFRNSGSQWGIHHNNRLIGYASVDDQQRLLQFYIQPEYLSHGAEILTTFLRQQELTNAVAGTNNPIFLTLALDIAQQVEVDTYLFRHHHPVKVTEKEGQLLPCREEDISRVVAFCHYSTGAPLEWLNGYVRDLVAKKEMFALRQGQNIIGTCEVRVSATSPELADIGMIVSPDYRQQGYGTYLLHRAKLQAIDWGKTPICSCEKGNLGSLKAIHNSGFVSTDRLLKVSFIL